MIAVLSLIVIQASASPAVPVVHDAPPAMLLAGYEQFVDRNINERAIEPVSAEAVFDQSHAACSFWLDAYLAKIQSSVALSNIDLRAELDRRIGEFKLKIVPRIEQKQASLAHKEVRKSAQNR